MSNIADEQKNNPEAILRNIKRKKIELLEANRHKKILTKRVLNPILLSVAEAAKFGGIQAKTIRRAIESEDIQFTIKDNRYWIDFGSLIKFLHTTTKRINKLNENGLGQYIDKWNK